MKTGTGFVTIKIAYQVSLLKQHADLHTCCSLTATEWWQLIYCILSCHISSFSLPILNLNAMRLFAPGIHKAGPKYQVGMVAWLASLLTWRGGSLPSKLYSMPDNCFVIGCILTLRFAGANQNQGHNRTSNSLNNDELLSQTQAGERDKDWGNFREWVGWALAKDLCSSEGPPGQPDPWARSTNGSGSTKWAMWDGRTWGAFSWVSW